MRLSKQERIAVLVIAVIIILGLGAFLFVVPKFQAIGTDTTQLSNKKDELKKAQDRAETKVQLGEDILKAYNEGKDKADMFFEEMKAYEADNEIREFLEYCDKNEVNVFVDSIKVGEPTVSTLAVNFFEVPEVTYSLKTAANSKNGEQSDEEKRLAILQKELASTQTIGSIDVTFVVSALNDDEMLKFIDIINNYKKDSGRKAIRLSSPYEAEFQDVVEKYQKVIDDMKVDLLLDSRTALATALKKTAPTRADIETELGLDKKAQEEEGAANNNNKKEILSFSDNLEQLEVTITLYSLERMQDPTDTLAAQEEE